MHRSRPLGILWRPLRGVADAGGAVQAVGVHFVRIGTVQGLAVLGISAFELAERVTGRATDTCGIGRLGIELGFLVQRGHRRMALEADRRLAFLGHTFLSRVADDILVEGPVDRVLQCLAVRVHRTGPLGIDLFVTLLAGHRIHVLHGLGRYSQ